MHSAKTNFARLGELVTPRCVDFNLDDYYKFTQKTRPLENLQIENLVTHYIQNDCNERYSLVNEVDVENNVNYYSFFNSLNGKKTKATFNSELALSNEQFEFLAVGHPVVDEAIQYYIEHSEARSIQALLAKKEPGFYFVFTCKLGVSNQRLELCACYVDRSGATFVDDGSSLNEYASVDSKLTGRFTTQGTLEQAYQRAYESVMEYCHDMAEQIEQKMNPAMKKEQYKVEISFGKKIRNLEEKRDIQKMQYRMNPIAERKGQLTRMENQILQARQQMQIQLEKLRRDSRLNVSLELLQIYELVSELENYDSL